MYWFTADEHYNHAKILKYCHRPFETVEDMNEFLITLFNNSVGKRDITVHIGDFGFFKKEEQAQKIIRRLNGNHIFVKGSHDRWLPNNHRMMWRKHIQGQFVVCCHYALRTWERAHHGAWNLYGHSHGTLPGIGRQMDVGVDCNMFCPVPFDEIRKKMDQINVLHQPKHDCLDAEIDRDITIEERMMGM